MMMLLSILCAAAVVMAVLVAMLGPAEFEDEPALDIRIPTGTTAFFAAEGLRGRAGDDLAVDVMLAQIERHVRLEQAAAESFLDLPSVEALQAGITPPMAN